MSVDRSYHNLGYTPSNTFRVKDILMMVFPVRFDDKDAIEEIRKQYIQVKCGSDVFALINIGKAYNQRQSKLESIDNSVAYFIRLGSSISISTVYHVADVMYNMVYNNYIDKVLDIIQEDSEKYGID